MIATFESLYMLITARGSGDDALKPYLQDARSDRSLKYEGLARITNQWAELLPRKDIGASAKIVVDVSDPLTFAATHLSLIALGYCSIPVDPDSPWSEFARIADFANDVQLIVSDREAEGTLGSIPVMTPLTESLHSPARAAAPTGGSVVLFTSGSTGEPKGVLIDERQLLFVAQQVVAHHALTGADRGYNSLPLFHINGEVVGLLATMVAGSTLVLDRRFHKSGFWELMRHHSVTWINSVPAIMAILARESSLEFPPKLRFIRSASAAFPDALKQAFAATTLVISYGMSEAASQITATPLDQPLRPGSVGVPVGAHVQVRGADGTILSAGTSGMLWIRGEGIIHGYLNGRCKDQFDSDGWLMTGDIGRLDDDGYVYLLGRSDDVINRGGEKLYPIEIENVILLDEAVREVIVTSRDDEVLGQAPVAYVVSADSEMTDQSAIRLQHRLRRLCDQKLARFKRPAEIIIMRDLPRAPTGKVKRAQLRQMAKERTLFERFEALAT